VQPLVDFGLALEAFDVAKIHAGIELLPEHMIHDKRHEAGDDSRQQQRYSRQN
jgi:hypothetical protein